MRVTKSGLYLYRFSQEEGLSKVPSPPPFSWSVSFVKHVRKRGLSKSVLLDLVAACAQVDAWLLASPVAS